MRLPPRAMIVFLSVLMLLPSAFPAPKQSKKQTTITQEKPKETPLPLKPARKLEFDTDQGTWMSVDVSPDGKTIIFDLVGDLYTMPFSGGEAKKITAGMAFNAQPSFSRDGKKIAFISDRGGAENVWIANSDGTNPVQLSQDEQSE